MAENAELAKLKCEACTGATPRLGTDEITELRAKLDEAWDIEGVWLSRVWKTKNFTSAFSRATAIALLAQEEGHHPDLEVGWGRVVCKLTTHPIGALSLNDFLMPPRNNRPSTPPPLS